MSVTSNPSLIRELLSIISSVRSGPVENQSESSKSLNQSCSDTQLAYVEGQDCLIECVIVPKSCNEECSRALAVEIWRFKKEHMKEDFDGLLPVFLKNAVWSFLHFSQLNIWLSENSNKTDFVHLYRAARETKLPLFENFPVNIHNFPVCALNKSTSIQVTVEYLNNDAFTLLERPCFCSSNEAIDESTLIMETSNSDFSRLKHKVLPTGSEGPVAKCSRHDESMTDVTSSKTHLNSVEELANSLSSSLVSRGRPRTKSSCLILQKTHFPLHSSPIPGSRQRNISLREGEGDPHKFLQARSSSLLGSFEESALKGRIEPVKELCGFNLQIAATGTFYSPHTELPVRVFVFDLNDCEPLPCLGTCSLESLGRKGYNIPKKGSVQATLFNPQGTVVKMFLAQYDVSDMPSSSQTFIRQRYFLQGPLHNDKKLQHLLHLRLSTDRKGRLFLHTDIRILFTQDSSLDGLSVEVKDNVVVDSSRYKLSSETETPCHPRYSPKK